MNAYQIAQAAATEDDARYGKSWNDRIASIAANIREGRPESYPTCDCPMCGTSAVPSIYTFFIENAIAVKCPSCGLLKIDRDGTITQVNT